MRPPGQAGGCRRALPHTIASSGIFHPPPVSGSNTGFLEWDELHRPGILNNARNELKIGVLRVLLVFSKSTMIEIDISIISV